MHMSLNMQKKFVELADSVEKAKRVLEAPSVNQDDLAPHLRKFGEGYKSPSPEVIREYFEGNTIAEIARMLGFTDPRSVRKWTQEKGTSNHREIPYHVWRLYLILKGRVAP